MPLTATRFEIIIPSYNNAAWCIENLKSAVSQNYRDFHITYINDCSSDETGRLIDQFVVANQLEHRVTIIHNAVRQGAMANLYQAIHACPNDTVIVTLDGDDFLAHEDVLTRLDEEYATKGVWLTFGQFIFWPDGPQKGLCRPIPTNVIESNGFRKHGYIPSHLRTFYAGLFKKIAKEDLLHEGNFFSMAWDLAMMIPMLEMAGSRHAFIADILYLYNTTNSISDYKKDRKLQKKLDGLIRSKPCYQLLATLD